MNKENKEIITEDLKYKIIFKRDNTKKEIQVIKLYVSETDKKLTVKRKGKTK